jgi:hypothetical protein
MSKIAANTIGGIALIARRFTSGIVPARLMPDDTLLLPSGVVSGNSNGLFSVVVVTLIDFPRSKLS